MNDCIYTDEHGRPFEKPERETGEPLYLFVRRWHAWRTAITESANRGFDEAFRNALKSTR